MTETITRKLARERLTTVGRALELLDGEFKDASYRHNVLVGDCIKNAREELNHALEKFVAREYSRAFNLAAVAWLQIDFARRLFETEEIEHLLGESVYLELSHLGIPWETRAKELVDQLKGEVLSLRDDLGAMRQ